MSKKKRSAPRPRREGKTMARLRAILKTATIAAIAGSATAASAAPRADATLSHEVKPMPAPVDDTDDVETLAHRLAAHLTELPPLAALGTTADLATSTDAHERLVLAGALAWVFPLASDDIVLSHLADDPDPKVRAAVAKAAWARQTLIGDTGILRRLLGDADADVRAAAWLAVRG